MLDDARDAEQVRPLLPGSPGCAVLITSRDRLDGLVATHGVQQIPLCLLGTDEGVVMLARILGAKRVEDQAEAARQLVRMCGHLPLALRVAAANLTRHPEQPIDGYLAELWAGDRLAGLAIDGDPRAAVRGTFDLSSQRLSPEARRMFRCLGLAPGPDLTADAAAALAAVPTAESARLLDRLAGVHLVEQPAVGRFALHDLLRLYAAEKAAHEDGGAERNAVVERLLAYYLRAADRAAELLYPQMLRLPRRSVDTEVPPPRFDDPAGALAWLDAERINLVAAIQHRADHPLPAVWLLADTLRGYFYLRRHTVDWLAAATAGVTAAGGNPSAQAAGHLSLALLKWCQSRPQAAIEEYRRALALAGEGGWVEAEVRILTNIGLGYGELGDLRRAADSCARVAELSRKAGLRVAEATALGNLGTVSQQLGNLEPAADYQARALALYREIGSRGGEANSLENLGEINHALGRLDRAAEAVSRALALNREVGSRYGEAYDLDLVAVIHLDAGRIAQALDSAHAALRLAREIGARQAEATTLNTLGTIRLRSGDDLQATEHYRQALDLAREVGSRWPEVTALIGLASAGRHPGEHAAAGAHARQALDLARHAGFRILQGNALVALAGIHLAQGHTEQAIELARQALAAQEATGHRLGRARALAVLGHALHHAGSADAASARWDDALALLAPAGSPDAGEIRAQMKRHHVPGTG